MVFVCAYNTTILENLGKPSSFSVILLDLKDRIALEIFWLTAYTDSDSDSYRAKIATSVPGTRVSSSGLNLLFSETTFAFTRSETSI